MTRIVRQPREFSLACEEARATGMRVGLVPTMGALHDGHFSLIKEARSQTDFVVVTVFVNPLQFAPGEDLDSYPRTFDQDQRACENLGVDLIFAPLTSQMYPQDFQTSVHVNNITEMLEGLHRPSHFDGVTTVVTKLFNLTGRCAAFFGRKDYQQWKMLESMARDLDMPVEVLGLPIVRENDGLAMSSRNRFLSTEDRKRALGIVEGLRAAHAAFDNGERNSRELERVATRSIEGAFDRIDYVSVVDPQTLQPTANDADTRLLVVAAHLGSTRLIDNTLLGADEAP